MRNVCAVILLGAIMACQPETTTQPAEQTVKTPTTTDKTTTEAQVISFTGTVRYKSFEGGFYALDSDDGSKYLPMGLDKQFHQDGLRVKVEGQVMTDIMTTFQYGQPFKVMKAEQIGKAPAKSLPHPTS